MITSLIAGMRVLLPSGNVVVLQRREHGVWVCEYHHMARQRGEVEFSGTWLRKYGKAL